MTKTEMLKLQVENLDKVLEHSSKLMDPHGSLISMTNHIITLYSSLNEKEKKSLKLVYKKSILTLIQRTLKTIERIEGHDIQKKAQSYKLKNVNLEELFLS